MRAITGMMLLALAVVGTGANADIRYFRYLRPISNTRSEGLTCVSIPPEVLAHAAPSLADLRLYRQGKEVPWALQVSTPAAGQERTIAPMNLGKRAGETVFDAVMPAGRYSDVNLEIGARDFLATVEVSGDNGKSPSTELGSFTVFDLTTQRLGRSTVLHLPESDFHELHFRIRGPVLPESVRSVSVEELGSGAPRYVSVATADKTTDKRRRTEIEFTVLANVPIDRIAFVPGSTPALFSRDISVAVTPTSAGESHDDRVTKSSSRFSGSLLRLHRESDGQRIDEERLNLDVPGAAVPTTRRWMVTVDNGDDNPVSFQSVRLEMLERNVCFSAAAGQTLLYYGDPQLSAPKYDFQRLFAATNSSADAMLGPEQLNVQYEQRPDPRPFTEKHPAILWIALMAVIALLGSIALRTARRTPASLE